MPGASRTLALTSLPSQCLHGESVSSPQAPAKVSPWKRDGSGDSDAFTFDPNTGRMTQYNFTVSGQSVVGTLGWNSNGTLQQLAITDPFEASNQQTCNYGYDSLARLQSANCGAIWSQSYNPDPFGNLSKSGTITFQPGFNTATNRTNIGNYDADGNLLGDTVHTYSYDADGNAVTIDSISLTYDAFDRMVEHGNNGTYAQMVYGPQGNKLAIMNGQTLPYAVVPLAGGTTAIYNSSGLWFYRHGDWMGSSRLTSLPSGTSRVSYDGAYAPYGESYAETGSIDHQFTGQNADTLPGGPYPLYDFLMREYHPTWGRWITPDPAGLAAVDPGNPQSWNRYAYVMNNPLAFTDPLGLECIKLDDGTIGDDGQGSPCGNMTQGNGPAATEVQDHMPSDAEMADYWFRQYLQQFYIDNGPGGGTGGGGGTSAPANNKPKPTTDNRPSCAANFIGALTGEPSPPHDEAFKTAAEAAAGYASGKALQHSAQRLLTVPLRSSIVRFWLGAAEGLGTIAEVSPLAFLTYEWIQATAQTAKANSSGACRPVFGN